MIANIARFLMGFAAAFAFVGALKLARSWFAPARFGLLAGATQALGMLNSEFTNTEAQRMAATILQSVEISDVKSQVRVAMERAVQRSARDEEIENGVAFIQRFQSRDGLDPQQALAKYCLLVMNLNEFIFVR